jgi:hypothetical protein
MDMLGKNRFPQHGNFREYGVTILLQQSPSLSSTASFVTVLNQQCHRLSA